MAGCQNDDPAPMKHDGMSSKSELPMKMDKPMGSAAGYREVVVGDNIYVVTSKDAAGKAKAGALKTVVAGPADSFGRKVWFEAQNEGALRAEYGKLHK